MELVWLGWPRDILYAAETYLYCVFRLEMLLVKLIYFLNSIIFTAKCVYLLMYNNYSY